MASEDGGGGAEEGGGGALEGFKVKKNLSSLSKLVHCSCAAAQNSNLGLDLVLYTFDLYGFYQRPRNRNEQKSNKGGDQLIG